MARRIPLAVLLSILVLSALSKADVLKLVIDDTIQAATEERIERALNQAAAEKDDAVLIELSTPGGLMDAMREIMSKIIASPVPVIIYVTPSGSRAASAGFFILESADIAAMAPGTNTGAAHPVLLGEKVDDVMKAKMENDAAAFMRTIAARRGRNVAVAESAVRESKSFTEQEALNQKLIDVVAADVPSLLRAVNGRVIRRYDGTTVTLRTAGAAVNEYEMTLRQKVLAVLM